MTPDNYRNATYSRGGDRITDQLHVISQRMESTRESLAWTFVASGLGSA
jgi:hypothetical protein